MGSVMRVLRVVGLFAAYGVVGFGGDLAAGLLAQDGMAPGANLHVPSPAEASFDPADDLDVDFDFDFDMAFDMDFGDADRCAFTVDREVALDVSAAQWLRLQAGSGELRVEGREGRSDVRAVGRACASDRAYLDELRLTLEERGGDVVLTAHYPDRDGRGGWNGRDVARIDLMVEIPRGMPVDLTDSSGGMDVRGTGELRIDDSSGEIRVSGVDGPLFIDDSSGEIEVRDVSGDVEIDDGSGEIDVADVRGSVRLDDGSGSIDVVDVSSDVIVQRDGSGSIDVRNVGGDFSVLRDGSGGIRFSGVTGQVDVPADKKERRRGN